MSQNLVVIVVVVVAVVARVASVAVGMVIDVIVIRRNGSHGSNSNTRPYATTH